MAAGKCHNLYEQTLGIGKCKVNAGMVLYIVDTYVEEACPFTGGSRVGYIVLVTTSLPSTILMRIQ